MNTTLPVSEIVVGDRHRKDLGDIATLAKSIRDLGLLHPVVITEDKRLVAGARRLASVKDLGLTEVPVRVVKNLDDALLALCAERDENTCRKEFTPSEGVAIAAALGELEQAKAKGRQKEGGRAGGKHSGKLPEAEKGDTRDKVAEMVGTSAGTLGKAQVVVRAAEEQPEVFGPVVEEMDRTGKVDPAFKKVKAQAPPAAKKAGKKGAGKEEPRNVTGACAELNRLVKSGKVERITAEDLVGLLPVKSEQQPVAAAGPEEVKRTVEMMMARRDWLRRAEWFQDRVRSPFVSLTERPAAAGPFLAKDKDQVLAALTEARDAISKWITMIEGWPVEPASATCASS